ncbi:preprotein translocase subunit SecA [Candidatus Peribacteria bacterium RIFCSPLOWO2_02_FULL_51_10]|nr:MAG: preprotein translocase subunit SecA [Candidatus Peribacteria bacterium RIFCSPLOWO2_02_FULL_51_10]
MGIIEVLNKILGDPNEKELKKLWPKVEQVNAVRATDVFKKLTLEDLPKKTAEFRERIRSGETVDDLLPEAFALVVRGCELIYGQEFEAGAQKIKWDMVPFDVQILGGIVLHRGAISEMKTGEGKTLVCTMPVYLNALAGKGVHVVTVNDYLAKRDSEWMGILYKTLGLTVGTIVHGLDHQERKLAYSADVTYGTNNEFGFDYLRDNMSGIVDRQVQRGLDYAIVDEVDSILIDEARTPLIISQPAEESTLKYQLYAKHVNQLQEHTHFVKDEKQKAATLTEEGIKKMEELLGIENIYTDKGFEEVHHIEQALRAHAMYQRDVDYVVKEGEVIIVDEFTGRLMPGRRYSYGLHQAIEAKENVPVQRESKTLATITFQNYFRLFKKLAGMTGTAKTEEEEFLSIYKLPVIVIPTNKPMIRLDNPDAVYATVAAKFKAVAKIAKEKYEKGQPVLIGTTSIEKSEAMSLLLTEMTIPHTVLNAKHHEKEAEIVAKAGARGAITIATNMAGRGTDIKLGAQVKDLGGLCILGTERHEARRIDNQLRGRSGRQGDPGESRFFVSMEDELMRLFGGDRLKSMMQRLKVPEDVPLENRMVSRSIESAQKKIEGRNFDIRRHVVQYDDVMNKHREIMYKRRQKLLIKIAGEKDENDDGKNGENHSIRDEVISMLRREAGNFVDECVSGNDHELWQIDKLRENLGTLHPQLAQGISTEDLNSMAEPEEVKELVTEMALSFYQKKCRHFGEEAVSKAEQIIVLQSIDSHWMDHIDAMSHLREQVAFSGYAQRDPLIEYQDQGFRMFQKLLSDIATTTVRTLLQVDFAQFLAPPPMPADEDPGSLQTNAAEIEGQLTQMGINLKNSVAPDSVLKEKAPADRLPAEAHRTKVGRNDPCPCGSGKKYKKCHGKVQ